VSFERRYIVEGVVSRMTGSPACAVSNRSTLGSGAAPANSCADRPPGRRGNIAFGLVASRSTSAWREFH
jgi:hypothetical protein